MKEVLTVYLAVQLAVHLVLPLAYVLILFVEWLER